MIIFFTLNTNDNGTKFTLYAIYFYPLFIWRYRCIYLVSQNEAFIVFKTSPTIPNSCLQFYAFYTLNIHTYYWSKTLKTMVKSLIVIFFSEMEIFQRFRFNNTTDDHEKCVLYVKLGQAYSIVIISRRWLSVNV